MSEFGTNSTGGNSQYLTAIQWGTRHDQLLQTLKSSRYNADLYKVLDNIRAMITELSKLEVKARQSGNNGYCVSQNKKIQESVDYLEKLILMLKLTE